MNEVIDLIVTGITRCYQILANFEILGTNMLTFLITLTIIGAMLPIILTIAQSSRNIVERADKIERKKGK